MVVRRQVRVRVGFAEGRVVGRPSFLQPLNRRPIEDRVAIRLVDRRPGVQRHVGQQPLHTVIGWRVGQRLAEVGLLHDVLRREFRHQNRPRVVLLLQSADQLLAVDVGDDLVAEQAVDEPEVAEPEAEVQQVLAPADDQSRIVERPGQMLAQSDDSRVVAVRRGRPGAAMRLTRRLDQPAGLLPLEREAAELGARQRQGELGELAAQLGGAHRAVAALEAERVTALRGGDPRRAYAEGELVRRIGDRQDGGDMSACAIAAEHDRAIPRSQLAGEAGVGIRDPRQPSARQRAGDLSGASGAALRDRLAQRERAKP